MTWPAIRPHGRTRSMVSNGDAFRMARRGETTLIHIADGVIIEGGVGRALSSLSQFQ